MTNQQITRPDPWTLGLGLLAFIPVVGFLFAVMALSNGRHKVKEAKASDGLIHTTTAVGMALAAVGIVVGAIVLVAMN